MEIMSLLYLTGIAALACPGCADVRSQSQRSIGRGCWLHIRLHCGVQRRVSVVWKWRQAVGRKAVSQGVSQLQPSEPIGHPAPPGLEVNH